MPKVVSYVAPNNCVLIGGSFNYVQALTSAESVVSNRGIGMFIFLLATFVQLL